MPLNRTNRSDRYDYNLFYTPKEQSFVNSIAYELYDNIIRNTIIYFVVDTEKTVTDELYGESKEKVSTLAVRIPCGISWGTTSPNQDRFGLDKAHKTITVYMQYQPIYEDLQFFPREGDFFKFQNYVFEVTSVVSNRPEFGNANLHYSIVVSGVITRDNNFLAQISDDEILDFSEVSEIIGNQVVPRSAQKFTISGTSGLSGLSGEIGGQGVQGPQGNSGISGINGAGFTGASGISGTIGPQGASGSSGLSGGGQSGLSGMLGISGISGNGSSVGITDYARIFSMMGG